ncbi:MAG: cysS [Candidatus Saccharibacteria bacterium]|nr:cysS [Candidatus Saccharibacteria bacterium]
MPLKLHNTLTKSTEEFVSQEPNLVKLYTCGPTVYDYLHVGNWAAYIYWDILVRTLQADGYTVDRVMNITDVGHLVSDADDGEDKLEKGARREGKTAWDIAKFYGDDFLQGMKRLNLLEPAHITKATGFIPQQLELVRKLKEKGYTYQIDDGIYFDTAKFPTYADFAGLDLDAQRAGARVAYNDEKRNPSDFALWKFTPLGEKRDMEWETPEDLVNRSLEIGDGKSQNTLPPPNSQFPIMGFPGWHLECSAMAMDILGNTLDIHTGGIDHIPVHHTNEIAQSESVTGVRFSNYWLHNNHLKVDGTKISKSLGNGYTLDDLEEKGFSPLDLRLFILQGQYSNEGNFTFDNLTAAKNRLTHWRNVAALRHQTHDDLTGSNEMDPSPAAIGAIREALNDDLNTPEALRTVDETFSYVESHSIDKVNQSTLVELLEAIDDLLGLRLIETTPDITDDQKRVIIDRERAREEKEWSKSDELRDKLLDQNIVVRDTNKGTTWKYK